MKWVNTKVRFSKEKYKRIKRAAVKSGRTFAGYVLGVISDQMKYRLDRRHSLNEQTHFSGHRER